MSKGVLHASGFARAGMASLMTGLGLSSAVFCVLTAQVWIYFRGYTRRHRGNRLTKVFVAFIWLLQAVEMTLISRIACVHSMEFEEIPRYMSSKWALYSGICSLTMSLVHGFFIYRVCCIEKGIYGKRRLSLILIALCVIEQASGFLSAISIFESSNDAHPSIIDVALWSTSVSLGCSIIGDILIAGTLAYILHGNRTESRRTNRMITRLMTFCLQTGLITTMAALVAIGVWAACGFEIHYLYMCFPVGCLYAICLLANFISRESYLQPQMVNETEVSKITFAPFAQEVHVDLTLLSSSDTSARRQEALAMQESAESNPILLKAHDEEIVSTTWMASID